jgi:large subunit ribosomal protein L22
MPGLKTNEREGTRAVLRHARVTPNKVREVLDLVRNKPVQEAEDILRFSERDAAFIVGKVLHSAIANAEANEGQAADELYVASAFADEGTTIKRWRPRARGRATRIRKRTSHITVIVARMPEAQLARLVARRRAEQLAQRARRVAGARKASGDTRSRAQRRAGEPIEAPEDEVVVDETTTADETSTTEATSTTEETDAALVAADGAEDEASEEEAAEDEAATAVGVPAEPADEADKQSEAETKEEDGE